MLKRIVVGYDFSEPADDALAWAADLARALDGQVALVHVTDAPGDDDPAVNDLRARLAQLADEVGPEVASHVVLGSDVAAALVHFAEEMDADAIVVATAGLGGMARIILGSVADAVVRSASCPVITIRNLG